MTDNTPPADAGQGGTPPAAASTAAEWFAGFPDELKGYVQNKGWKDPGAAVESYRNLEKLRGVPAERLLTLPDKPDAPEWSQVWDRLGRPQTPDQYELTTMQGNDPAFSKAASEWFHKRGIPKDAARGLAEDFNAFAAAQQQSLEQAREQQAEVEWNELKREWGQGFEQSTELARRAAKQFGVAEETLAKLEEVVGPKELMKLFARIGEGLGEHKPEGMGGGGNQQFLTPDSAKARIQQLQGDKEWVAKYLGGDASAKAEMDRLMRLAHG